MIELILSGEGNSDIGEKDIQTQKFIAGPITILTINILNNFHKFDLKCNFVNRMQLKKYPMTLKGRKKRDKIKSTGKGHSNLAYKLACIARENNFQVAILMRDARKDDYQAVYEDIMGGFQTAMYQNGVAAIPVPESEEWIISCLNPKDSLKIEDCKTDMKKLLEQKLIERNHLHNKETWCDIAANCVIEKIDAPSFNQYRNDLEKVVKYLF
jgi:hypothetical protein